MGLREHLDLLHHDVAQAGRQLLSTAAQPTHRRICLLMLAACVVTFAIDFAARLLRHLHWIERETGSWYLLTTDRGLPEITGYLVMATAVIAIIRIARQTRSIIFVYWIVLAVYLIVDDSLKVHETAGEQLAAGMPAEAFGLQAQDIGELLYIATVGSIFFIALLVSYAVSDRRGRALSIWLMVPIGSLVAFALGMDVIHAVSRGGSTQKDIFLAVVEDGGELFSMWLFLMFVISMVKVLKIPNGPDSES